MQRTKPPFRADMVGSLLRTAALKEARHKHHEGEITGEALKDVEDREIRALIKRQEEIGLQAVTDGEFRRAYWHFDFLEHLDGVTSVEADSGMNFKGGVGIAKALRVTGKVGFSDQHEMLRQRGDDPEKQPEIYAGMVREALKDKPDDLTIPMHLCRGNFRSTFIASGGYEPVAETLFSTMPVDGYFMEWDTDRAGGFEPLRFLPKDKTVVLGLVTSKTGTLESRDDLKRRIEEATKF